MPTTSPPCFQALIAAVLRTMTQEELGDELGVHRVTVARWATGATHPQPYLRKRILELASELGVRP
jgi:transcriptional regulator with XRE-family HTH domain